MPDNDVEILVPFDLRKFLRTIRPHLEGKSGYVINTVEGAKFLINKFTIDRLPQQLEERGFTLFKDNKERFHVVNVDEDIEYQDTNLIL